MSTLNLSDTNNPATTQAAQQADMAKLQVELAALRRCLTWLTVGVFVAALAQLLWVAAVYAAEIDFHYGEYKLIAGACTGGVLMGFLFGWLARRTI